MGCRKWGWMWCSVRPETASSGGAMGELPDPASIEPHADEQRFWRVVDGLGRVGDWRATYIAENLGPSMRETRRNWEREWKDPTLVNIAMNSLCQRVMDELETILRGMMLEAPPKH